MWWNNNENELINESIIYILNLEDKKTFDFLGNPKYFDFILTKYNTFFTNPKKDSKYSLEEILYTTEKFREMKNHFINLEKTIHILNMENIKTIEFYELRKDFLTKEFTRLDSIVSEKINDCYKSTKNKNIEFLKDLLDIFSNEKFLIENKKYEKFLEQKEYFKLRRQTYLIKHEISDIDNNLSDFKKTNYYLLNKLENIFKSKINLDNSIEIYNLFLKSLQISEKYYV